VDTACFDALTRALGEPFYLVTAEGTILSANPAAARDVGLTVAELQQRRLADLIEEPPEKMATFLRDCARSTSLTPGHFRWRSIGSPEAIRCHGCLLRSRVGDSPALVMVRHVPRVDDRFSMLNRKIDELQQLNRSVRLEKANLERLVDERTLEHKRLEAELRQAQKLEAVGQLAAGIAHEINTPAQFVGDSLRFLSDSFREVLSLLATYRRGLSTLAQGPGRAELLASLATAEEAADLGYIEENAPPAFERALEGVARVATIVGAMKEFSHVDRRERAAADLNRALMNTLTIARNEYKHVADTELDLGDLPQVMCNVGEVNQVFLNLLVNAAHAIADVVKDSGQKGCIRLVSRAERDSVVVSISDTGTGIPEAVRDRVFDPFFTTKAVGRGTGQGLAIARSVVDKHGGTLSFESEMGRGTTFYVRLPTSGRAFG
jgi:signal transduction histidine kinase